MSHSRLAACLSVSFSLHRSQNSIHGLRSIFILHTSNLYFAYFLIPEGWKSHSEWLVCLWADGVKCCLCDPASSHTTSQLCSAESLPPGEACAVRRSKPNLLQDFRVTIFFPLFYFFCFPHNQSLDSFFFHIQAWDQTGQTSALVFF